MATKTNEERGVNPKNWGPYGHLPELTTDSIEDLLKLEDWKLAVKELIIHSAKLEIRIQQLETIIFHSQED
jgi:hypothetical protein